MKKYIVLGSIIGIGGWQTYISNKITAVKDFGWLSFAIGIHGSCGNKVVLPNLRAFEKNHFFELNFFPSQIKKTRIKSIINKIEKIIDYRIDDDLVFEGTTEELLLWAELFASHFRGKSICVNVKNQFPKHSETFIHYLLEKEKRGELLFVNNDGLQSLFKGSVDFEISPQYVVSPLTFNETFDDGVDYKKKMNLRDYDFVIGAIGWMDKEYYPELCRQIDLFSKEYKEKKMAIVLIGKSSNGKIEKMFRKSLSKHENVKLFILGPLSPIPSNLVQSFDVCVASFGSAVLSDKVGTKTIMMYDHDNIPLGIMGYTLTEWPYHLNRANFELPIKEMLKQVLIEGICSKLDYHKTDYGISHDEEIAKHIFYLNNSSKQKSYFDIKGINEANLKFKIGAILGNAFGFGFVARLAKALNHIT